MTTLRDRTAWLSGGEAVCLQPPTVVKRAWRLILLGPPGSGKGTLAGCLFNALGACPLSTGDVFRAAKGRAAPPGSAMAAAQVQMERGELVTDETVLDLIRERRRCLHCSGGFMLDGFPRTLAQAQALDALLVAESTRLDAVVNLEVPDAQLISRLSGRRVCPQCKSVFHIATQKPRVDGLCDQCGVQLTQRPDDHAESVCVRLASYHRATEPLASYYRERGLLVSIPGAGSPGDVLARALDALAALPQDA